MSEANVKNVLWRIYISICLIVGAFASIKGDIAGTIWCGACINFGALFLEGGR